MTSLEKKLFLEKNDKIIDMVIERVKRDFPQDIVIIGLSGSISTEDFHEKSDLDLIIINDTDKGWGISHCFIMDDIGYDIYCTPWEPRIYESSELISAHVSTLTEMKVLYSAGAEFTERLEAYKRRALELMAQPIGRESLLRAKKWLDKAKADYADVVMSETVGEARMGAGRVLLNCINAIVSMNNTCIKRGIKRYTEEIMGLRFVPAGFEALQAGVIGSRTTGELGENVLRLLRAVAELYQRMWTEFVTEKEGVVPCADNLRGTYEELWCNCRNKIAQSTLAGNAVYAFHAAVGAQDYLDEMHECAGTRKYDLLRHFDENDLPALDRAFMEIAEDYLALYAENGLEVCRYDGFDELYAEFMKYSKLT